MTTPEQDDREARWRQFEQLGEMRDHWWWRPGWRQGRSAYTWHLTFPDAREVHESARRHQAKLDLPTLDPVPVEWLHLTMQNVGFSDEVSRNELQAVIEAAERRCRTIEPFVIRLGPADADPEGVMLRVAPWEPVEQLRAALRSAIADVWGLEGVPEREEGFRPHVTVAYSNAKAPASLVRERLALLQGMEPIETAIRAARLIRLNRDEKIYRWDVVASVGLGGGP
jgi:2'-5' RNA ligase